MRKNGRPLKYETVEELQTAIEEYFANEPDKPTISGLALHLGFESRKTLYNYKGREKFLHTIEKGILRIENKHEQRLYEGAPTGSIFWLKTRGWNEEDDGSNEAIEKLASELKKLRTGGDEYTSPND